MLQTLRENGLKRGAWNEGEDHVALEFEFMQRMSCARSRRWRQATRTRPWGSCALSGPSCTTTC